MAENITTDIMITFHFWFVLIEIVVYGIFFDWIQESGSIINPQMQGWVCEFILLFCIAEFPRENKVRLVDNVELIKDSKGEHKKGLLR